MIVIDNKKKCCGCRACYNICPQNCISMKTDNEGFLYPVVDGTQCVNCGLCEKICPISCNEKRRNGNVIRTYGANSNDLELRENSSSGGIFGMMARIILSKNGVVFGAAFSDDFRSVNHVFIENETELFCLQGSKYLQSDIGDSYKQAESFLKDGRFVLFSGTPCQVAGLKAYLRKDYDNLLTLDVICHGVPSPMVWEKYVDYREAISGGKTKRMSFRHKKYGWKTYSVLFEYSNNTEYVKKLSEDLYMQVFLHNINLRPSCYECAFRNGKSGSDMTIADYWGVQVENPELDDDKGTSLVIVHSDKGQQIFDKISSDLQYKQVDFNAAIRHNTSYLKSVKIPEKRECFFQEVRSDNPLKVMKKYAPPISFYKRVVGKMKHVLRSILKK